MGKELGSLAFVVLSVLVTAPLSAQAPYGWVQVATNGPAPRVQSAMTYDSQRGRTVLFGGLDYSVGFVADTWEWNGTSWTQAAAIGPSVRSGHAMAYDSQRGRTVLFGGSNLADTWEWDGGNWTLVSTSGPPGREFHAMVYDMRRGRTLMCGGSDSGLGVTFSDTWEWDGSNWLQVAAIGPIGGAMAYDNQRGRTVLIDGASTWEWDGQTWAQVASAGPSARYSYALTYDIQRGQTVLFGGYSFSTAYPFTVVHGDSWEWDGSIWSQVATTGPGARHDHLMAYDSQRGRSVLFGGYDSTSVVLSDTWELNGGYTSTAIPFGNGCGLNLGTNARPTINTTAQVFLASIPASLAYVALGWSRTTLGPTTLPLSLAPFGMPGCDLLQSAEFATLPVTPVYPSLAYCSLPLPNVPTLIGLHAYLQGWAYAPAANSAQLIVSNGLEWIIGDW